MIRVALAERRTPPRLAFNKMIGFPTRRNERSAGLAPSRPNRAPAKNAPRAPASSRPIRPWQFAQPFSHLEVRMEQWISPGPSLAFPLNGSKPASPPGAAGSGPRCWGVKPARAQWGGCRPPSPVPAHGTAVARTIPSLWCRTHIRHHRQSYRLARASGQRTQPGCVPRLTGNASPVPCTLASTYASGPTFIRTAPELTDRASVHL